MLCNVQFMCTVNTHLSLGILTHFLSHYLSGLVVKASALRAADPGFESCLFRDFSGMSHTSDLKIGTPVVTLQGTWCDRVRTGTG